jgi:hypothetical protein
MDKKLRRWSIIGVFVTFALAGGWHFLFELVPCGFVAAIAPANESPWEHAKLFFMPALIWYLVQYFIVGKHYPNFIFAHSIALLVMPSLVLLLYYAYVPLTGESLAANLINSFAAISAGAWLAYRLTISKKDFSRGRYRAAAMVIVLALLVIFTVFTFAPPHCGLFWDPSGQHYGISLT